MDKNTLYNIGIIAVASVMIFSVWGYFQNSESFELRCNAECEGLGSEGEIIGGSCVCEGATIPIFLLPDNLA